MKVRIIIIKATDVEKARSRLSFSERSMSFICFSNLSIRSVNTITSSVTLFNFAVDSTPLQYPLENAS